MNVFYSDLNLRTANCERYAVMNKRKHQYFFGLILACLSYGNILKAGSDEEACESAYAQLSTINGGYVDKQEGEFIYRDWRYQGCILTLKGDKIKVKDDYHPANHFYPFKGSIRYRDGWRADSEADGPDGSFFRLQKSGSFCLIEGRWDGGYDSDSKYIPSPEFSITAKCAAEVRH